MLTAYVTATVMNRVIFFNEFSEQILVHADYSQTREWILRRSNHYGTQDRAHKRREKTK